MTKPKPTGITIDGWVFDVRNVGRDWKAIATHTDAGGFSITWEAWAKSPGAALDVVWKQSMETAR